MRTKVTLALIFLNGALFLFIFYFLRPSISEANREHSRRLVLGSQAANLQKLEIVGGAEPVRMERRPDGWYLTAPMEWPVAEHAMRTILNELQLLEREASFTKEDLEKNGLTLADYGLDKPALTLTLTPGTATGAPGAAVGPPIVLQVGAETKGGNRLYILSPDGERVLVVRRTLLDSLRLSVEQLRSDSLFTIPQSYQVRSLSLQVAAATTLRVRLRHEGNRWFFETPIRARASKDRTELAINQLSRLSALTFLPQQTADLARTGLANPVYRVTLEGINRRETLLLGAPAVTENGQPAPGVAPDEVLTYAKLDDRPPIFTTAVPKTLLATLRDSQEKLREKRILDLDGRTVIALTLRAGNLPELTLQRLDTAPSTPGNGADAGVWQIVRRDPTSGNSQTLPADSATVTRLLQQLAFLDAKEFLSDAPSAADLENWGFSRPLREIAVSLTEAVPAPGTPPSATSQIVVQIGIESPTLGLYYARLDKQDYIYLVDGTILNQTPVEPRIFREKRLRELPAGASITGLSLSKLDGTAIFSRKLNAGETWATALAASPAPEREAVELLLQHLRTLRAKSIVQDAFFPRVSLDGEEKPWTYRLDTTLAFSGAGATSEESTLFLSERTGGGTQLAGSADFGGVIFEVEQPLLDALWTLTYGPRDPGPLPDPPPPAKAGVP